MTPAINLHAQAIAINCVMVSRSPEPDSDDQKVCQFGLRMLNSALTALTQTRTCLAECCELIPYLAQTPTSGGDLIAATEQVITQMLEQACIATNEPFLLSKQRPTHTRARAVEHSSTDKLESYNAWFEQYRTFSQALTHNAPTVHLTLDTSGTISFHQIGVSTVRLARVFLTLSTDLRAHKHALANLAQSTRGAPVSTKALGQALTALHKDTQRAEVVLSDTYRWVLQQDIIRHLRRESTLSNPGS